MVWILYSIFILCGVGGLILRDKQKSSIEQKSFIDSTEENEIFDGIDYCAKNDAIVPSTCSSNFEIINPTTGAPMIGDSMIDITGKYYGEMS